MPQTYEMTCVICEELRWPYLTVKPDQYTCMRCKSGTGASRRISGLKGAQAMLAKKAARSKAEPGQNA